MKKLDTIQPVVDRSIDSCAIFHEWVQSYHILETAGIADIVECVEWDEQWVQTEQILETAGVVDIVERDEWDEQWVQT